MLSTQGGMDIEEVADSNPSAIATLHVDPLLGFQDFHGRRLAFEAGVDADLVRPVGAFLHQLYGTFVAEEAMLVEVNPLIVTPERKVAALDAKVTLDDNALFRHPDNAELRDPSDEDPQEQMAHERGLTYVKLDGDIGILGNGAGLVMSTLDVVAQYGGAPANFLDAGGGSKAEAITSAVEVILSDDKVKAVLFNIFGGITRCDEVANGLIEAFKPAQPERAVRRPPGRHQRRGGPEDPRRGEPAQRAHRGDDGRGRPEGRGAGQGGGSLMAVLIDNDTKLVRLRHHRPRGHVPRAQQPALRDQRRRGRHAGQGRPGRRGHPGVQHVPRRRRRRPAPTPRWSSCRRASPPTRSSRPPTRASRWSSASPRASRPTTSCASTTHLQRTGTRLVGPNCPGILSPGKANVGIIPASFFKEGNVGVVSRSGTLTYQIGNKLAQTGFGNSSIVGIGGDPVPGSSFIDIIELFEADDQTELIVLSGEIGGDAEERAADYIAEHVTKPVVAYIAGLHGASGQDDGPRGRDRLRLPGHRGRQGRGAGGQGRARRADADAGRRDRRRDPRRVGARPL